MAEQANLLTPARIRKLHQLCTILPGLLPEEAPALIHGDLWAGNFLVRHDQQPVLIDPAVCYAHREMDLAMSQLFGGFHPAFYQSYQAAYPMLPGHGDRMPLYQLYYLLVHLNLFGLSYLNQVANILDHYVR